MVIAVEDIVDKDSLKAWLDDRPKDLRRHCAVFIASRAASRVAPIPWHWFQFDPNATKRDLTSVPFCRSHGISVVGGLAPNADIKSAASAAYVGASAASAAGAAYVSASAVVGFVAADAAARASADAAYAAVRAAAYVSASAATRAAAYVAADAAIQADCHLWLDLERAGDIDIARLQSAPLWPDKNRLATQWTDLKAKLIADATSNDPRSADWSFWIDWYEGLLEGRAQNIDMLLEIVTTDKIDWEAPPREVNEVIAGIVERYALDASYNAEHFTFDEQKQRIVAISDHTISDRDLSDAYDRIRDAIDDIRNCPPDGNMHIAEDLRRELNKIERVFDKYSTKPIRIVEVCWDTIRRIETKQDEDKIPNDHIELTDFKTQLDRSASDIIAIDEATAKALMRRGSVRYDRLERKDRDRLVKYTEQIDELLEDELREEFQEDREALRGEDVRGKDGILYRVYSRALRIARLIRDNPGTTIQISAASGALIEYSGAIIGFIVRLFN